MVPLGGRPRLRAGRKWQFAAWPRLAHLWHGCPLQSTRKLRTFMNEQIGKRARVFLPVASGVSLTTTRARLLQPHAHRLFYFLVPHAAAGLHLLCPLCSPWRSSHSAEKRACRRKRPQGTFVKNEHYCSSCDGQALAESRCHAGSAGTHSSMLETLRGSDPKTLHFINIKNQACRPG
jgi:hypothetical protein